MSAETAATTPLSSRLFDGATFVIGLVIAVAALLVVLEQGAPPFGAELLSIPMIVLIARFPMLLDSADGGIEIGFDSTVLVFLLCTLSPAHALVLWSIGAVVTQLTTDKRPVIMRFNIGVSILGGAAAAVVITVVRGDAVGEPREMLAVLLAAAAYFAVDFVISAVSVGIEERASIIRQMAQPGAAIAVACFVPFDSLGYLAAVVLRSNPWWTLLLLAVPLATLLLATRAVTRGRENTRRLGVLFEAAVRAQSLTTTQQVMDALVSDTRRLLRIEHVEVRALPPAHHEIGARLRDGERERWIVAPVKNRARSTSAADEQALNALAAVAADAFSRLRLTQDMTHLARHDLLTNLPNRGLLLDRLEHALLTARRRGSALALIFCDLDGFKPVNDRFGHAAGDTLLVDVGERLTSCVRESDTVARLGGDEFAILLEDVRPHQVDVTCERILSALNAGALVAGHQVPLSASLGVAVADTAGEHTAEALLRNADLAMYEAKTRGKDQYVHYESSLGDSRVQRLELLESLRAAIANRELTLVYQPVTQLYTGRIVGVEALCRWESNGESVPPDVFIRAAEEGGLIVTLGELVLDLAAADAAQLQEAAGRPLYVAVNISAQQLRDPTFVSKVQQTAASMSGTHLMLEITERDCVDNDTVSLDAMRRLSTSGIPFAIDDFGIGFSSIGYLQDMPVRTIKADASFSAGIDRDEMSCGLLCSITMMGKALELDVVVEGVERETQLEHLREHVGAPYVQGYFMHRPMPLKEVVEVLRGRPAAADTIASSNAVV